MPQHMKNALQFAIRQLAFQLCAFEYFFCKTHAQLARKGRECSKEILVGAFKNEILVATSGS